ncbi:MAG TPA: DNA gyrase modulator, partial [bacterium]|nr:DNA gyrase modulator [bacterium]
MNRREFLKVTAKGGALAAASPLVLDFLKRSDAFPATVSDSALPGLEASLAKVISKALASGGQYADVYLEEVARTSLSLADGKVNSVNYGIDKGGGVRVLANWRTGYAYCDSWDETALTQVARVASEISRGGGAASSVKLAAEPGRGIVTYQVSPDAVDASRKAEVLTTIDSVARGYDPAIKQVRATFRDELRKITIATSDGTIVRQELPLIWIDVSTLAERGDKRSPGYARRS